MFVIRYAVIIHFFQISQQIFLIIYHRPPPTILVPTLSLRRINARPAVRRRPWIIRRLGAQAVLTHPLPIQTCEAADLSDHRHDSPHPRQIGITHEQLPQIPNSMGSRMATRRTGTRCHEQAPKGMRERGQGDGKVIRVGRPFLPCGLLCFPFFFINRQCLQVLLAVY